MTDYEKYQLRCMINRGYSLRDLMKDLTEFQSGGAEDGDRTSVPVSVLFDEWAAGSGIWTREEEWRGHEGAGPLESHAADGGPHLVIVDGVVRKCTVPVGDAVIPEGVAAIGDAAFQDCTRLTGVAIPASVTEIGAYAFAGCARLTGVTLPEGIGRIKASTFTGCESLTGLDIPDGVTEIGTAAFAGCTGLTGMTIPEKVTKIGLLAFWDCHGLTSIAIPGSVVKIGDMAFKGCRGLTIHAPAGSCAERYAKGNGIGFEAAET